jgi:hypothetical protein
MKLHGLKPVASWSEILKRPFFILALSFASLRMVRRNGERSEPKGKVFWPRMYKITNTGVLRTL